MATSSSVESCTVETSDGVKLHTRVFKPREEEEVKDNMVIVLVHPYSILGGCQGLLRGIAVGLADKGYRAVTFDMRGAGRSTGKASITGSSEILDVVSVCKWVADNLSTYRILLVDLMSSVKGAPISGSAVDQIEPVVGYVSLGYPFGLTASILFGRHHKAILKSPKPKLFVMGTKDGFTSVKQLENKLKSAAGRVEIHLMEGVGHFQMEGPAYDSAMVDLILEFIASL
ncbi:alpha/beta-Hydrolases superfamily protein [Thalictrum thalictroides]|uniref:Alpha/beta-Hydrolases superfamily protein n=1 Tax=Thalictrum thalictroides TaxID=46969 RepID=A0A7J6WXD0_THATH|nr:alpha/beta-Hydrolases superfamily protein [Thalictrum thalictroides]